MSAWVRRVCLVSMMLCAWSNQAVSNCNTWTWSRTGGGTTDTSQYPNLGALQAAIISYCGAHEAQCNNNCSGSVTCTTWSLTGGGFSSFPSVNAYNGTVPCSPTGSTCPGGNLTMTFNVAVSALAACPICPASGSVENVFTQSGVTGTVCGSDGCLYTAGTPIFIANSPPGTHYNQTVVSSGQACNQSLPTVPSSTVVPTATSGAGSCQVGSGGTVACDAQPTLGAGCGTFNGDQVCVGAIPAGSCVAYPSGGVACVSTAAPQPGGPAPNNGTPGVAAAPVGQVIYNTTTVNYYSSSAVAVSSAVPVTHAPVGSGTAVGGAAGGVAAAGSGDNGTQCGNGVTSNGVGGCVGDSVVGGSDCVSPPVCSGDAVQCDQDFQAWHTRCSTDSDSDLATALGTVTRPVSTEMDVSTLISETAGPATVAAGSCPAPPSVSIEGHTVSLNLFVQLCTFAGYISYFVLAVGYLSAAYVFFRSI